MRTRSLGQFLSPATSPGRVGDGGWQPSVGAEQSDTQNLVRDRVVQPSEKADKGGDPPSDASKGRGHKHGAKSGGGVHSPMAGEPAPDPKQVAAIQAVGVAFLDSRIKQISAATEWLLKGAPGWRRERGG